jgi:hypothetical protein
VNPVDALVARVNPDFCLCPEPCARFLEKPEIVPPTIRKCCADDFSRGLVNYYLRFDGVTLLLARIPPFLFFLDAPLGFPLRLPK